MSSKKPKKKNTRKTQTRNMGVVLMKWVLISGLWVGTAICALFLYYVHDLPDLSQLEQLKKQRKVTILSNNNEVITNFGDLYGQYLSYKQIPQVLVDAVVATEDRRFFQHFGIDVFGLIRAAYINFRAGHVVQGGSTITQQLAKIAFLTPDRHIKRKVQEFVLAINLEKYFSKEQIMAIYLNRVYLGSGIYGIDAAAKYYFGKKIYELNLYEAAIIAGLLKAPSKYAPTKDAEVSGKRAYQVLLNMVDAKLISKEQLLQAASSPVVLETAALGSHTSLYFADYVLDQLNDLPIDLDTDVTIKTTLDPRTQMIAERHLVRLLDSQGPKLKASQGALVVLSKKGEILAMVGGKNHQKSAFNRAVQSKRQPGSAFKLFVYLAALEHGYVPSSMVIDSPVKIKKWQPRNYTRQFLGEITLRTAFAQSINTVAVKLSEEIGRKTVIKTAHQLGIYANLTPLPSIALGSTEVNLLELTGSFAAVNNHGYQTIPYGIKEITDGKGKKLFTKHSGIGPQVLTEQTVSYMQDLLSSAIEVGTGKAARVGSSMVFGKTGTTQDYRDAWFIGFDDHITLGVWVGNDDNKPMNKVTGGGLPAIIWKEVMAELHGNSNAELGLDAQKEVYEDSGNIWQEVDK